MTTCGLLLPKIQAWGDSSPAKLYLTDLYRVYMKFMLKVLRLMPSQNSEPLKHAMYNLDSMTASDPPSEEWLADACRKFVLKPASAAKSSAQQPPDSDSEEDESESGWESMEGGSYEGSHSMDEGEVASDQQQQVPSEALKARAAP